MHARGISTRAKSLAAFFFFLSTLLLAGSAWATNESIPCTGEPTDMAIAYGNVITCAIDIAADTDTFRFSGRKGERVVILASRQSGGTPCVALTAPDLSPVGGTVCNAAGAR